jgi:2,4-dienoyl-CoA reductase-like NADH-dependent reductase (Old Yellow Enzyme family)
MNPLFTPFRLRNLELPNRVVVSPMCQYSAVDGNMNDWHLMHLGQLAFSGAGLLFIEMSMVEPRGRITPGCAGLYSDENEVTMRRVIEHCRRYGDAKLGIQLGHAGRRASTAVSWEGRGALAPGQGGWETIAPSALPWGRRSLPPRALMRKEIAELRHAFVVSAERALRLDLDVIELHGAHGYILHQFLSPISNQRTDEYGGSLENRMRFPLEVFDAVREVWPSERPLGMRISATDWVQGEGWNADETVVLSGELKARGCDFIDCSSGGLTDRQVVPFGPGYNVPFAARVRREVGVPTIAVGGITEAKQADEIVASGEADLVALARAFMWNPRWVWHAAAELGAPMKLPGQYMRAEPDTYAKKPAR